MRSSSSSLSWTGFAAVILGCMSGMAKAEPVNVMGRGGFGRLLDISPGLSLPFSELPTSTNSAPATAETPILEFSTTNLRFTTCTSVGIVWGFSGPIEDVTFSVTNINVTQSDPPTTTSGATGPGTLTNDLLRRGVIGIPTGAATTTVFDAPSDPSRPDAPPLLLETISTSISPSDQLYVWNQVNVPQGWYRIIATATNPETPEYEAFTANSSPFFVSNGSDTSCLITTGSTGSSPSQTSQTLGSSETSSSGPSSTFPIGASQSSSSVNKGAIAGGAIGALAFLAALIAVLFICHRRRRRASGLSSKGAPGSDDYPEGHGINKGSGSRGIIGGILPVGRWGKLGSFDASGITGKGGANGVTAAAVAPSDTSRSGTRHSTSLAGGRKRSLSNSNSMTSSFGSMRLAALGFATSQKKGGKLQNPYTASAKRDRRRTQESLGSLGPMMGSFTSSMGQTTSKHTTGSYGGTDEEYGMGIYANTSPLSPYEKEKGIPMSPLHSPGSSVDAAKSPFSDPGHIDENLMAIASGSTPSTRSSTPSTSRTNSRRSAGRVPAPTGGYSSSSSSSINVNGANVVNPSNISDRSGRSRSQSTPIAPPKRNPHRINASASTSQANSPISPTSQHQYHPSKSNSENYGARRASSPDYGLVVPRSPGGISSPTLPPLSPPPTLAELGSGSTSQRKTPRKPVPSYNPEDPLFAAYADANSPPVSPPTSPKATYSTLHSPSQSQSYSYNSGLNVSNPNIPNSSSIPPTNNSSSSVVGGNVHAQRRLAPPHVLEHKDSDVSLRSLRELGGGGKPMHVLIPDMPIEQQQQQQQRERGRGR